MGKKLTQRIEADLSCIREQAQERQDGNTVALVNGIMRSLTNLQDWYRNLEVDQPGLDTSDDETKNNFVAASYDQTAAKDINPKAKPPTGESNTAPFLSKADLEVGADGSVKYKPGVNKGPVVEMTEGPGDSVTFQGKDDAMDPAVQEANRIAEEARLAAGDEGAGDAKPVSKPTIEPGNISKTVNKRALSVD